MSHMPEPREPAARNYHPLSPELLLNFHPTRSFFDSPVHAGAYTAWYDLLQNKAPDYGLNIARIPPRLEPVFAHFVHRVVATNVVLDINYRRHEVIDTAAVTNGLNEYYQQFPPSRNPASDERVDYQDEMIPVALQPDQRRRFLEIGVVLGLRSAFVKNELRHPSRATAAILSVYGSTLYTPQPNEKVTEL
jgi:hypothetical protein